MTSRQPLQEGKVPTHKERCAKLKHLWRNCVQKFYYQICPRLNPEVDATWTFLVQQSSLLCHLIWASGIPGSCSDYIMWRSTCATLSSGPHPKQRAREIKKGGWIGNPQLINTLPLSLALEDQEWVGGHYYGLVGWLKKETIQRLLLLRRVCHDDVVVDSSTALEWTII